MEKLKFWAIAIGFILFLWFLTPEQEPTDPELIAEALLDQQGKALSDNPIDTPQPMKFKTGKVPLTTRRGNLPLVLGFAHTDQEQRNGLMFYRVWPKYMHGLLFLFKKEDQYSMWMRNTYLPLDIVFIDRDGYIVHIVRNTTPESDAPIKAPEPVLAIMEIPAGSADKWNLQKGDRFRLKYFRSALPS